MRLHRTVRANELIAAERREQDAQFGDQSGHSDEVWLAILMEEVGELSQVILHRRFGGHHDSDDRFEEELAQVAAVATAWLEGRVR